MMPNSNTFHYIGRACVIMLLVVLFNMAILHADTIILNNGGKLKCKEIIHNEDSVICKFDESQLIVKKDKIKEIQSSTDSDLYQNTSNKDQIGSDSATVTPPVEPAPPEDAEKKIQDLENTYNKDRSGNAKTDLVDAYDRQINTMYRNKSYKKAIEYASKLEKIEPTNPEVKLKMAFCYFMISDQFLAEHYARAAKALDKDYADAYFLLGEIYYHQNNLNDALYEWQMGLKIKPSPEYEEKLNKLSKELNVSSEFLKTNTRHFKITFDGNALNSSLTNPIINILEDYFKELSVTFNYYPTDPIQVIFYSNQDFKDVLKAPYWSTGVYDGKIRMPAKNIKLTSELSPILKHELTHAIISQKTNYNAPAWLEEGLAQFLEGERPSYSLEMLKAPSIEAFPQSFTPFKSDEVKLLYGKSLSFVAYLQEQYGMWKILMLLDTLGEGKTMDEAFRSVFLLDLNEVEQQWSSHINELP
jgi:tetratricopeptide (TPR) repeat protein